MELHIIEEDGDYNTFICYIPNFITGSEHDNIIEWLSQMNDFVPSHGYNNNISRLQKWYQQDNKNFCNTWTNKHPKWEPFNYESRLNDIQSIIQEKINNLNIDKFGITIPKINSCLINKYRTGEDFITAHRDTKLSFGEYPTIVGLSLGSSRNLLFKRVKKYNEVNTDNNFSFKLDSGSLFIMGGSSQKYYTHEIPVADTEDIRYSLTFREFI